MKQTPTTLLDLEKSISTANDLLTGIYQATQIIDNLQRQVATLRGLVDYYEGTATRWVEDTLMGGMKHRFDGNGNCIRCGINAEEWEQGCVEELRKELAQVKVELATLKGEQDATQ